MNQKKVIAGDTDEPTFELEDLITEDPAPWQGASTQIDSTPLEELAPSFDDEPATFEDPEVAVSTALEDLAPSFDEDEEVTERPDYMAMLSRTSAQWSGA